jgi:benzoyl-CoA reductase subunit C
MSIHQSVQGLDRARDIYRHRTRRATALKGEGRKVFGYFCCYAPLELMTALDIVPMRVLGDMDEPITAGDTHLPTVMCSFYRSCLDLAVKGRYEFLDGFLGTHGCDCAQRVGQMWRDIVKSEYDFFLDVPHTLRPTAIDFFKRQIEYFKESLEQYSGAKITREGLAHAIKLHNDQRDLVRDLYNLRKPDPPLITGAEVLQVMIALMCIPVREGNHLLREVVAEVESRGDRPKKKPGRLLVWGSLIDNTTLLELAESTGLHIVVDDTAIGTRSFLNSVPSSDDPLKDLARHYLESIYCPRTYKRTGGSYRESIEQRFGYLQEFIEQWHVNGVYLNLIRNCDCHGFEIPAVKDYLEGLGLPVLTIEQDYSTASLEPLRTRFQAFAEAITL